MPMARTRNMQAESHQYHALLEHDGLTHEYSQYNDCCSFVCLLPAKRCPHLRLNHSTSPLLHYCRTFEQQLSTDYCAEATWLGNKGSNRQFYMIPNADNSRCNSPTKIRALCCLRLCRSIADNAASTTLEDRVKEAL